METDELEICTETHRRPGGAGPDASARRTAGRGARPAVSASVSTAVLFATAPAGDGGPAAALAWEQTTLLGRLLGQLAELGIREAHLITRPGVGRRRCEPPRRRPRRRACGCSSPRTPPPTCAPSRRSRARGAGALVVANADILTQGEALAGLLADPRIATGMLTTTVRRVQRYMAFRTRDAARARASAPARRTTTSTSRTARSSAC